MTPPPRRWATGPPPAAVSPERSPSADRPPWSPSRRGGPRPSPRPTPTSPPPAAAPGPPPSGNDALSCLDLGDLYALLGSESVGFDNWSDADALAAELAASGLGGSHAPYPDASLVITAPGA